MKVSAIVSSILLTSLQYEINATSDSSTSLRGSMQNDRRALRVQHPCTLVRVESHYEHQLEDDGPSRERMYNGSGNNGVRKLHSLENVVKCELQKEDRMAVGKYFVTVNGIETGELENIVSGDTTLIADEAMIMDGQMWLPAGAAVEYGSNGQSNRRLQEAKTQGIKKVLVVRANARGSATTATKETLSDKIFGANGDTATLKSQYLACSHGKLDFQPFEGMTAGGTYVDGGVIDVNINTYVPGSNRYDVEDALEEAADKLVGGLHEQFDHVMLCLPPGSTSGRNTNWIAYGYINSWLSVFNDDFCKSMSTQVHEIGHNLGLAHSAKDGLSYGDKTGMMGYSYNRDNGPLQCFNPAKTYQLGWLSDKVEEVDPDNGTWIGKIIGVADYSNAIVDPNAQVIVKIKTGESKDIFVGYNRKKGMNSEVEFGGNTVTIVDQGSGYSESDFLASLNPFDSKTFYNFRGTNKNLVVDFVARGSNSDEAIVAIYYDTCVFPRCCTGPLCDFRSPIETPNIDQQPIEIPNIDQQPRTPAPTQNPTDIPTRNPTNVPTRNPTNAPKVQNPTPTRQPTPSPTRQRQRLYKTDEDLRKELLSENFRQGLGVFNGRGNSVEQMVFEYILTAKFELKEAGNLPSIYTTLDLQNTSLIQVSFWYNAEKMQKEEGFKVQYSSNHGNSWRDVKSFKFGESGFDETQKWSYANAATFEVTQGMSTTELRIVGDTQIDNSDSVFYIAAVSVVGIAQ